MSESQPVLTGPLPAGYTHLGDVAFDNVEFTEGISVARLAPDGKVAVLLARGTSGEDGWLAALVAPQVARHIADALTAQARKIEEEAALAARAEREAAEAAAKGQEDDAVQRRDGGADSADAGPRSEDSH